MPSRLGLIPAAAGLVLFGVIQRSATRFARPELWVFAALMGAETLIVLALALTDGLLTPAMALVCWPVAGLAGRFPDRASRLGTLFAVMLAGAAVLATDPGILTRDPLALSLLLVAFVAIHTVATVLRDSDVERRGAAVLDPLTGMLAYRLRKELRAYDLAYRLGGEEFVVLLLGATPAVSLATAERICTVIGAEPMAGLDISVSIGVAARPPARPSSGTTSSRAPTWRSTGPRQKAATEWWSTTSRSPACTSRRSA